MSAESELVIVEESSDPTKDAPEVKERFRVLKIAITYVSWSPGFMNFDHEIYKPKIQQKQRLLLRTLTVWKSAIAVDRKYKFKFSEF